MRLPCYFFSLEDILVNIYKGALLGPRQLLLSFSDCSFELVLVSLGGGSCLLPSLVAALAEAMSTCLEINSRLWTVL